MKRTLKMMLAAVLSLAMLVCFAGAEDVATESDVISTHAGTTAIEDFADAPAVDSWKYQGLNCAAENGIMQGHEGLIRPDDSLTRAELVTMMVRVLGAENFTADLSKYVDMATNAWYYDSIEAGVAVGIINGSEDKMMPTAAITREQTFAILARTFLLIQEDANSIASFNDAASISAWAKNATNALVEAKVVLGDANNSIRPKANVTRAEFAAMLDRIACFFAKPGVDYSGKTIDGSVIISDADVDLTGAVINGDVYLVEALGENAIDLTGATINGRIVVRSGEASVADGDEDKIVTPEDMPVDEPVVVPPVDGGKDDSDAKDSPDVSTTPGGNKEKFTVDAEGTYVSWGADEKTYATINDDVITFDLSDVDGSEVLKNLFVKANKDVAIAADGFYAVNLATNEEYAVADILVDMLDSTSKSISKMLGITDASGNVAGELTVASLADKIETAYVFYTSDASADKWMQKLFDERGIICDEAANKAAFVGTIGSREFTIVIIAPELP